MKKYLFFVALLLGTAVVILWSGCTLTTEWALSVLVLALSADFLTTYLCLRMRGTEGNPIVGFLFRKIGVFWSFGLLVGVWGLFIWFRWLPQSEGIQTAVSFAYWWVPLNNILVLRRLRKEVT